MVRRSFGRILIRVVIRLDLYLERSFLIIWEGDRRGGGKFGFGRFFLFGR